MLPTILVPAAEALIVALARAAIEKLLDDD
jgi:hypothetical protein